MRKTKKITISALMSAIGAVFLTLGAVFEVMDLTASAFASLIIVFIYIEVGSPYTYLVWLVTSVLSFVFFPGSIIWAEYFAVFGIYPIMKAYIEKLPRQLWLLLKILYANLVIWLMMFACQFILKIPFFEKDVLWFKIAVYVILNAAFLAYDIFLTVMVRFYFQRLRHRFKNLLK